MWKHPLGVNMDHPNYLSTAADGFELMHIVIRCGKNERNYEHGETLFP
jgi:hypothetical protein